MKLSLHVRLACIKRQEKLALKIPTIKLQFNNWLGVPMIKFLRSQMISVRVKPIKHHLRQKSNFSAKHSKEKPLQK